MNPLLLIQFAAWGKKIIERLRGTDDIVLVDEHIAKIGAWGRRGVVYRKGEAVPQTARGHSTYSVQTRQGWWVSVAKGKIAGWSVKPIHATVIDADGKPWKRRAG